MLRIVIFLTYIYACKRALVLHATIWKSSLHNSFSVCDNYIVHFIFSKYQYTFQQMKIFDLYSTLWNEEKSDTIKDSNYYI